MTLPGKARWTAAAAIAVMLHAGVALIWMYISSREPPAGGAAGSIAVSFEAWGGASAGVMTGASPAQAVAASEAGSSQPAAAAAADDPAPAAQAQTVQAAVTVPAPATIAEALDEPDSSASAKPPPLPRPPKEPPARKAPTPRPESPSKTQQTVEAQPQQSTRRTSTAPAPSASGFQTVSAPAQAGADSEAPAGARAAGEGGSDTSFIARLRAWLVRHQRYPDRARARRQQGTVLLAFVMDRQGAVLNSQIHQSSGHTMLDREALEMLARAQPLPAIPASLGTDQLEIVVPIQFVLRR